MKLRYSSYLIAALALVMVIAGCGGSGSTPPPPPPAISVVLSPQAPSSLTAGTSAGLTAMVSNDSANAGVKWSVTCGSSACGSFSAASTASGAATTYTAPASVPSPATVTVTATSVTDATKSATAMITISAPGAPIAVTLSAPTSVAAGATAAVTATVTNDSANAGVTWSVTCGSAQCGSFNPTATPSGTATTYTAPATPPSPATVTVTATSVTDTTKSASASITITAPPPILADANYVYHLAGQDGSGYYYVAGAFTVANGVITAGEQDAVDDNGNYQDSLIPAGSSLSLASGNIQVVLNTGDSNLGVNGVETLRGTVVSSARALISQFDTFATANGSIDQQTSTAAPAGGYGFSVGGFDGNNPQNTFGVGGILNISGSSIAVGSSVFDYNDGGEVGQNQTFASGTVGAPDAFGRVVFTLTPSAASGVPPVVLVGYTVSAAQIQLVESTDPLGGDLGGEALGQGSNTGQFNAANVTGSSFAFGANGQDAFNPNSTVFQMAGVLGLNAGGLVSGPIALNDLVLHIGSEITSGTYSVDASGRVTINVIVTVSPANQAPYTLPFAFQLYLDGNGNALELGVDTTQVTWGPAYQQNAPSGDFEGSYALSAYGFGNFNMLPAWTAIGPATVASDMFSGHTDMSVQNSTNSASAVSPGLALSGSETSSSGQLNLNGLSSTLSPQAQSSFGYFPIDSQRVLALELDSQQTGLMMLEQVQAQQ
jgi:hypothetical protein